MIEIELAGLRVELPELSDWLPADANALSRPQLKPKPA
jgi:hypothetical protein